MDKAGNDNRANQCNPNNDNFQGHDSAYQGTGTQADLDNHANQGNPNNAASQSSKKWSASAPVNLAAYFSFEMNWLAFVTSIVYKS